MKQLKNKTSFFYSKYLLTLLPNIIKKIIIQKNELLVVCNHKHLFFLINFLKNHFNSKFKLLIDICAVDYPEHLNRFEVSYNLLSIDFNVRIRVKTYIDSITPLESIVSLYSSANWYEREVWDMFGIFFLNHPDLRRILTDYGFQGYPLRKDFPQTGFTEISFDDAKKQICYVPVEISQEYRYFDSINPWQQIK